MGSNGRSELVVSSFGSGSNGNAYLIEHSGVRLLLDAGIPISTLLKCLAVRALTPSDLNGVLVSHEHVDHIRALTGLLRRHRLPVFATRGTHSGLQLGSAIERIEIKSLRTVEIGDLRIVPFPVSHDAREPIGFSVEAEDSTVTFMTDLGEVSEVCAEFAERANHLVIEANYDVKMLRSGPYPAYVKQRIRSNEGHLSNIDCAEFLVDVLSEHTQSIWLAHLSVNNNHPDIALQTVSQRLGRHGEVRELTPLPRYDGSVLTWRSSDRHSLIHQPRLPF